MANFEQEVEQAIKDEIIPGCVLNAVNRDGSFNYAKAFGARSMRPDGDRSPLQLDTVMWIASCTKLMTSICAVQLVERGLLNFDDPVYKHIPELKDRPVITGINDDGTTVQEPHKTPITLRHLLTHSSGLVYDQLHPSMIAWGKENGEEEPSMAGRILERFNRPLAYEPGTSWSYGPSVDYAGLIVERVSGKTLEEYMKENLWEPLGIKDMTFNLGRRPDLKARLADMSKRDGESGKVVYTDEKQPYQQPNGDEVEDCMGGQGVFTSAEEYIKVLHALLTADENDKIFKKKETVELFFSPHLSEASRQMINAFLQNDDANNAMGGVPKDVEKDWGLGGLLIVGDSPDGKKERTMIWGGLPNLIWFCDRKAGLTGLYAGQVLPPGDALIAQLTRKFEAGVYELYKGRSVSPRL